LSADPIADLPRVRWHVAGLLGTGVLVNYFDRIALSVAAPRLQQSFGLSPVEVGVLFSAFFWSYALLQIPTGMLLDRFGVQRIGRWSAFLWSAASALTACAGGFAALFLARVMLGVAEAPGFPLSSKATGYWFPREERALSTSLFDGATKVSNVIGVPLIALVITRFGWRAGFASVGALSLAYFLAFFLMYRDPSRHSAVTGRQRRNLAARGAVVEGDSSGGSLAMLMHLLGSRKVWGLSIGFAAYGYCFFLFLTWLPGYLVHSLHMSLLESAGFTMIPWTCASVSALFVGGWLIDHLVARGRNETRVRKTILLGGMCIGVAVFGATTTTNPAVAITWISIALSGLAAASPVCWSLPSLIAPQGGVGSVGGIMNFANNSMGVAAPIVTGYVLSNTHSFSAAFLIAALVLVIGVASFVLLLGRIEPIPGPGAGAGAGAGRVRRRRQPAG
jgi:MFS transporter, ACS family, D-galactonate transporter